jgi:hypothetical protein
MPRRTIITGALIGALVGLGGCQVGAPVHAMAPYALATLGPAETPVSDDPDVYHLGAGDSLGQEIFRRYVAALDVDRTYATGF